LHQAKCKTKNIVKALKPKTNLWPNSCLARYKEWEQGLSKIYGLNHSTADILVAPPFKTYNLLID